MPDKRGAAVSSSGTPQGLSSGRSFAEQKSWSSRSLGGKLQHGVFYFLLRVFGIKPARVLLFFVVLVYCLRPSIAGRSRHYLQRRFGPAGWRGRFARLFRLYWSFGVILLERAAGGILGRCYITTATSCHNQVRALLAEGRGLILLSGHVGAWQLSLAGLRFGVRANIVQPRGQDVDRHVFEHSPESPDAPDAADESGAFNIIDPNGAFGGFVDMHAALKRGEIVCLMGDRLMPEEKLTVKADFLGGTAVFPGSAYVLAAMTGAPVAIVFTRRLKQSVVRCDCYGAMRVPRGTGKNEEALKPYAEQYVAALENFVKETPYQFFNFHNIWL